MFYMLIFVSLEDVRKYCEALVASHVTYVRGHFLKSWFWILSSCQLCFVSKSFYFLFLFLVSFEIYLAFLTDFRTYYRHLFVNITFILVILIYINNAYIYITSYISLIYMIIHRIISCLLVNQ